MAGLTDAQAKAALQLAEIATTDASFVERVRALGVEHETLDEGLEQLAAVMTAANEHAPGLLVADLKIARGLDYFRAYVCENLGAPDERVTQGELADVREKDGRRSTLHIEKTFSMTAKRD